MGITWSHIFFELGHFSPPSPTLPETHKTSYHQCHLPLHLLPTQAIQAALLGRVIKNPPRVLFSCWRSSLSSLTPTQLCILSKDVSQETTLLYSTRKSVAKTKLLTGEKFLHLTAERNLFTNLFELLLEHLTRSHSSSPYWDPLLRSARLLPLNHKSGLLGLQHCSPWLLTAVKLQSPHVYLFAKR